MPARPARRERRPVHGIVLLDKPEGLSSNQALQVVRGIFGAAKAGHTGSLDPLATGLLPVCLGEATKIAGLLLGSRKAYEAECLLGVTTNTDDAEGEVLRACTVPPLASADLDAHLRAFVGRIQQVPPAFSALKRNGVPMYVRARRGEEVQLEPREVTVHGIDRLAFDGRRLRLRIECGSGTYIRSLARDLGERIGCGAHLTALRRTWVEPFRTPHMHTLETLRARAQQGRAVLDASLLSLEAGLADLPRVDLDAAGAAALQNGQVVRLPSVPVAAMASAHGPDGRLLALVDVDADGRVRVRRGFNLPGSDHPA